MPNYMGTGNYSSGAMDFGFDDFIKPVTDGFSSLNKTVGFDGGLLGNTANFLNDNSKGIGALGGLYSAYSTQDMAKKQYKLQKDAYNFNKMLSEREMENQDDAKNQFAYGFSNSNAKV